MRGKPTKPFELTGVPGLLLGDIRQMIEETRAGVAATVNAGLTMLYWRIGRRVGKEILKGERAEYGQEIVPTLSAQLVPEFGKGFGVRNLFRMIKFAEVLPDKKIVSILSARVIQRGNHSRGCTATATARLHATVITRFICTRGRTGGSASGKPCPSGASRMNTPFLMKLISRINSRLLLTGYRFLLHMQLLSA